MSEYKGVMDKWGNVEEEHEPGTVEDDCATFPPRKEDPIHPIIRQELEAGVLGRETWLFDEIESAIFRLQRLSINYYSGHTGDTETGRLIDKLYDIHFNKGGKV